MALTTPQKHCIRAAFANDNTANDIIASLNIVEAIDAGTASIDLEAGALNVADAGLSLGGTAINATAAEINNACDRSANVVTETSASLTITEALHHNKIIVLDRAGGIAVTLPAAAAGLKFTFYVKTTFTGAASIKSVASADIMIGQALLGNNTDNSVVAWQATAAGTFDTIDLFGTANSTGGIEGQKIVITGLATNLWHVDITGDAAGTEATPFANTV